MIDYIVFPIADIGEKESAKIKELNLVLRENKAKDKALMKCLHFQEVFPEKVGRIATVDEEGFENVTIEYPYETYSDKSLYDLLDSPDWKSELDEMIEPSPVKE